MGVSNLYSPNDNCTASWRAVATGDSSPQTITNLLSPPGCAERILNYVTACDFFQTEVRFMLQHQLYTNKNYVLSSQGT